MVSPVDFCDFLFVFLSFCYTELLYRTSSNIQNGGKALDNGLSRVCVCGGGGGGVTSYIWHSTDVRAE